MIRYLTLGLVIWIKLIGLVERILALEDSLYLDNINLK